MRRVGIVGAGIAGVGAAWALARAGVDVEVFEASPQVGGNARTHTWSAGERRITAGLAVLAWPEAYFRNYGRLLGELKVASEPVRLRFFIRKRDEWYAHDLGGPLAERYAADLRRWRRMVEAVRTVNRGFAHFRPRSLYHVSFANPMNLIPLRALSRLFGVSRAFWDDIVVALYSSSFLTTRLDRVPAVIIPTLDDLISAESGGSMRSWSGHSGEVFERMLAGLEERVHVSMPIEHIRADERGVELRDGAGATHRLDDVILAGNAHSMARALDGTVHPEEKRLLGRITYVEATDSTFTEGHAHSDATVLAAEHRDTVLGGYCTYVDIVDGVGGRRYENTFVVSSWAPAARGTGAVMLVTYDKPAGRALAGPARVFSNRGGHPDLSLANLLVTRALRRHQGSRRLWYCGSYTTPGNGHDLSFLSGLVVAGALGAPYPFHDDAGALEDYMLLRRAMLGA